MLKRGGGIVFNLTPDLIFNLFAEFRNFSQRADAYKHIVGEAIDPCGIPLQQDIYGPFELRHLLHIKFHSRYS
jgi:hypothetical protein